MIESFLSLASKALGVVERVKDITTKKLSAVVGGLALRCGWLLAFANAALIIIKHIDFSAEQQMASARFLSRNG